MKANYAKKKPITTTAEKIEEAVKPEVDRIYEKVGFDIASQFMAVVLSNLEINYGWKRDRLKGFVNNLHSAAELACGTNVMGNKLDTSTLIQHYKNKYGIDCRKEVEGM